MQTEVIVRFAPSPTGYIHVGNVRIALMNWLFAKKQQGKFILRFDDTDESRSREEYRDAIREDLKWLGLIPQEEFAQRERMDIYAKAIEKLKQSRYLYPCFETPEELSIQRKLLSSQGLPPLYDRTKAYQRTPEEIDRLIAEGHTPHWRFRLHQEPVTWQDLVRGDVHFETLQASDPVVIRADGCPLYTLTSVIDDIEMGVSHVVRGEDHVVNTAVQLQIFNALGGEPPRFAHISLLMDREGKPLSKRIDSLSIQKMREQDVFPHAIRAYLTHLGTNTAAQSDETIESMIENFHFSHYGRAAPNFDENALATLNRNTLQNLTFAQAQSFLPTDADENFWQTIRHNIACKQESIEWFSRLSKDLYPKPYSPTEEDECTYLQQALSLLPHEGWHEDAAAPEGVWTLWQERLQAQSERRGKKLLLPLRLALTGMKMGPALPALLQYLGHNRVGLRLEHAIKNANY